MNKQLIVIDAQEDFVRGALRNEEAIAALPVIREAVAYASRNFDRDIIYTKDTHNKDYLETQEGRNLPYPHCIKGSDGWEICPEVLAEKSKIIKRNTFGSRLWDMQCLDTVDEIWLCGFCTDICVSANFQILKSTYPEVPIVVIEDACAGVTKELHEAALKVMKSCQARITALSELIKTTEDALAQLTETNPPPDAKSL